MNETDDANVSAVAALLGGLTNLLLTGWLLSLCATWLFPMLVLPYWKWLVITLTIQSLAKTEVRHDS